MTTMAKHRLSCGVSRSSATVDGGHFRNHPNSSRLTNAPIFRCRPLRVNGTPMRRESRAFAAEMPSYRLRPHVTMASKAGYIVSSDDTDQDRRGKRNH